MAEEKLEWVFDSLVEFLRGPVWNIPILTFTEQKSVVFEPGAGNEEEFKKIHENYKNLVDFMLGSYMEDLEITPEQFEKACAVASKTALTQFHQNLFEQVWAADDFEIFRRMMTQKNLELQLQALEVLAQRYGLAPDFMEPVTGCKPTKEEETIMKEVIRRTIEENREDPKDLEDIISQETDAIKVALEEKSRLEAEKRKEKDLMDQAMKLSLHESSEVASEDLLVSESTPTSATAPPSSPLNLPTLKELPPLFPNPVPPSDLDTKCNVLKPIAPKTTPDTETSVDLVVEIPMIMRKQDTIANHIKDHDSSAKPFLAVEPSPHLAPSLPPDETVNASSEGQSEDVSTPEQPEDDTTPEQPTLDEDRIIYTTAQVEVTPMDMERRQSYLRQQRDRLLAMKRQERTKHLISYEETTIEKRPKSSKAARRILQEESHDVDPQTLAFRKSLANRLKNEVVDQTV